MTVLGIIGDDNSDAEIVEAALNDLMEKAAVDGQDEFKVLVGIGHGAPDVYETILTWLVNNELFFQLVVDKKQEIPEEYTNAADKTVKAPDANARLVAELVKAMDDDTKLLVLVGDPAEMSDSVNKAIQKATEAEIQSLDLSDGGLDLIEFGDATAGPDEDTSGVDLEAAGTAADTGDGEAIELLTQMAVENDLDPDAYATWLLLAEALFELRPAAEEEENEPEAVGWTAETLPKELKDLKAIAKAENIDGYLKMNRAQLTAAILGEEPEETPAAPAAAAKAPKAPAQPKGLPAAPEGKVMVSTDAAAMITLLGEMYRLLKKHFEG